MNRISALSNGSPHRDAAVPMAQPQMSRSDVARPASTEDDVGAFLVMIERAARDPAVNIDKMERLMQMRERVVAMQAEREFNEAMQRTQAALPRVFRNKQGDKNTRYADLEAIDIASRPIITANGFSESYGTTDSPIDKHYRVTCTLAHVGGHSRPYQADIPTDMYGPQGAAVKTAIQGFGSAMSYGRRYLKCLIFNIVLTNEDDDGRAAGGVDQTPVSPEQVEQLRKALDFVGGDEEKFCRVIGVLSLADIFASKFEAAMKEIRRKQPRQTQGRVGDAR